MVANALREMRLWDWFGCPDGFEGPDLVSALPPALVSSTRNKTHNDAANGPRDP